jgi:peptide-methionine (S)-S-oxide reductase
VAGVKSAVSGYAGGSAATATYEQTGTGRTGHAESVRILYDPKRISYGQLLQIYFSVAHDPTELNRQGPDTGTQYRSTIFPADAEQARVARSYIEQINRANTFGKPLATTVEPLKAFYPAEAYHQDFLTLNPRHPYIAVNDLPKIENLKRLFPAAFQAMPVLVGAAK